MINVIILLLCVSMIGVYVYVFVYPWLKGTYVKNDKCSSMGWKCEKGSYCCKDPRPQGGNANCMLKECSSIRLVVPKESQIRFFNIFITVISITLVVLMIGRYM
jgi:hypothetical protein